MRLLVAGLICSGIIVSRADCAPLHPYVALHLPDSVSHNLRAEPVGKIHVGPLAIQLEVTALRTVQGKLGGTIQSGGDAAGAADWLCFTSNAGDPPVIYWFISNREMGGGLVTEVAIQTNNNGVSSGCGKALAILSKIDLGIPSIGSGQRDVATHFASGRIKDGIMSYASERPQGRSLRDALGFRAFNIGSKTSW